MTQHECVEKVNYSNVSVNEKGKQVTLKNKNNDDFLKVRLDKCLIKEGPRADWLLTKVGHGSVFVELKGRDVHHAVEQLFASVTHPACIPWTERPTKLLIICAKYPSFDTTIAKAQVRARKLGLTLKLVCRTLNCEFGQI